MIKIPAWLWLILGLALLLAFKFLYIDKGKNGQMAKGKGPMPVACNYVVVKPRSFNKNLFATGRIGAFNQVEILPELSGKLKAIYFKEGATVQRGELLAELANDDLQAQLAKITVQLDVSEKKLARLKKLLAINGVSQEELEIQEGEVKMLQSDKAIVGEQLRKTKITAPFSGEVGLRNVSEGAYVTPATPIVSLVQLSPVYVEFSLPEKYSALIKPDMVVDFTLDADGAKESHKAEVFATEARVDETTRTIRLRAVYKGSKRVLPGSFARVNLNPVATDSALVLPTQCIVPTLKGQKVYVYRNGAAVETMVATGLRLEEFIQITDGLAVGDTVLTTGLLAIKKDSKIVPIKSRN